MNIFRHNLLGLVVGNGQTSEQIAEKYRKTYADDAAARGTDFYTHVIMALAHMCQANFLDRATSIKHGGKTIYTRTEKGSEVYKEYKADTAVL